MNVILFLIFLSVFFKNKKDRKRSDLFRGILLFYFGILMISMFFSSPFFTLIGIGLIISVASRYSKDKKSEKRETERQNAEYERMRARWAEQNRASSASSSSGGGAAYTFSSILPKPVSRRMRIVSTFNDKYNLSLTKEEIERIANASYVSESWKREIEAMTVKYDTEVQWFAGPTDWLRVYIYAFEIQNISSDFVLQEQICFETLDEVMAYACATPGATIEERIRRVNERYFTRFNEMTFMIAYRFLQRKGRTYDLSRPDPVRNVDIELEETMKKYRNAPRT